MDRKSSFTQREEWIENLHLPKGKNLQEKQNIYDLHTSV